MGYVRSQKEFFATLKIRCLVSVKGQLFEQLNNICLRGRILFFSTLQCVLQPGASLCELFFSQGFFFSLFYNRIDFFRGVGQKPPIFQPEIEVIFEKRPYKR